MTKVISVINEKGGVGKSTISVGLADSLAKKRKKVLLIDMDSSKSATTISGIKVNEENDTQSIYTCIGMKGKQKANINDVIIKVPFHGYDMIPGSPNMLLFLNEPNKTGAENKLKLAISKIQKKYDYIIIDNCPTFNLLSETSLIASDYVLIPVNCDILNYVDSLEKIIQSCVAIKVSNINLKLLGIVINKYSSTNNAKNYKQYFKDYYVDHKDEISEMLYEADLDESYIKDFEINVFHSKIRYQESPHQTALNEGRSILDVSEKRYPKLYDDYIKLAEEVIKLTKEDK